MGEFDLSRILVWPKRKLIGVTFRLKARFEALPLVTAVTSKHSVMTAYFASSPAVVGEDVPGIAFFDITDADTPFSIILSELESTGMVKILEIIEPVAEGLLIDNISHPLTAGGERAIILRGAGYRDFVKGIKEQLDAAGKLFLYFEGCEMGKGYGKLHRSIAKAVGIKDPIEICRRVSLPAFQWAGFGRAEIIQISYSGGTVAIYDSFECEGAKVTGEPYGDLTRGILAGVYCELFGKDCEVRETECLAKGDKRCVFEIKEK
uniref:4-vinyl reductase 4VR domain-containing protein n=1 Tax=Candidatus Methanomethylicus mesodigestus TaxID=1867258 RepID=A0A7C3ITF1_9CREN